MAITDSLTDGAKIRAEIQEDGTRPIMKSVLRIFVKDDCSGCIEAQRVAAWIEQDFPHLRVELVDIGDPQAIVPEAVFATPTYMLNSRIVSLGNPSPAEVTRWAENAALPSA